MNCIAYLIGNVHFVDTQIRLLDVLDSQPTIVVDTDSLTQLYINNFSIVSQLLPLKLQVRQLHWCGEVAVLE